MEKAVTPARKGPREVRSRSIRKPREERWSEILDAAATVFHEKGYSESSLQDIAKRVGILKGSIYYYIDTKEDLLGALVREAHDAGLRATTERASSECDPLTRLYRMIVGYVFFLCDNIERTTVLLHELIRLDTRQRAKMLGDENGYRRLFQAAIDDAQSLGLVRAQITPKLAAICILSSLNSTYTWYRPGGEYPLSDVASHLAATALMGLATPKGVRILAFLPPPSADM